MRGPRKLVIELPPGMPLLNANDRIHYRERAKRTEKIRSEAFRIAKDSRMTFGKVKVRCIFRAPDNRRRDSANLYPSWKAALDGVVDAGCLKDDNDKYVTEFTITRGENLPRQPGGQIILEVIEDELCLRSPGLLLRMQEVQEEVQGRGSAAVSQHPHRALLAA